MGNEGIIMFSTDTTVRPPTIHADHGRTGAAARSTLLLGALGAAIVLALATSVYADARGQSRPFRGERGGIHAQIDRSGPGHGFRQRGPQRLGNRPGLTPEQREKIRGALRAHREEVRDLAVKIRQTRAALRQAAAAQSPDADAIRAAGTKLGSLLAEAALLRGQVARDVKAHLTPVQSERWQQLRDARRGAHRDRFLGGAAGRGKAK